MKLWVDDEREAPEGWTWVRTSEEATVHLANHDVAEMSLDYKLANKPNGDWDDGGQVLTWLKDHLDRKPAIIVPHSGSSAGRDLLFCMIEELA